MFFISHKRMVTGVIKSIVVTLSKNEESTAVNTQSIIIRGQISPRAKRNAFNTKSLNDKKLIIYQ